MIAYASRYGHQPIPISLEMLPGELQRFNDALFFWLDKENQSAKDPIR